MLRNCFWHSYHKVQQVGPSISHQTREPLSDARLDDQMKINPNNKMYTKKPTYKKLIVDEVMA
jgi:hypothetical protein